MNKIKIYFNKKIKDEQLLELLKGSSSSLIIRLIGVFSNYFFTFLIANFYGASTMGLFALSQTALLIASILSRLGFDTASVKFVSENYFQNNYNKLRNIYYIILKIVIPFSLSLSVGFYFFASFFSDITNKPEIEDMFRIVAFGIFTVKEWVV